MAKIKILYMPCTLSITEQGHTIQCVVLQEAAANPKEPQETIQSFIHDKPARVIHKH